MLPTLTLKKKPTLCTFDLAFIAATTIFSILSVYNPLSRSVRGSAVGHYRIRHSGLSHHSLHSKDLLLAAGSTISSLLLYDHLLSFSSQHGLRHGRYAERRASSPRGIQAGCFCPTQRHSERHETVSISFDDWSVTFEI